MESKTMATNKTAFDHMTDKVVEQIKAAMERGDTKWIKPWTSAGANKNPISKTVYKGANQFMLTLMGFTDNRWLTFKQISALKGTVNKGAKGTFVTFWKIIKSTDKKTELATTIPLFKCYIVFNVEQTNLVEIGAIPALVITETTEEQKINTCESIISGYKDAPSVKHGGDRAFYTPDYVQMPLKTSFSDVKAYYATLFHEFAHSTGYQTRLNRDLKGRFGSDKYAYEELVAELSAAFLAAHAGIDDNNYDQSAAYLGGWLKPLQDNPKMFEKAAREAYKVFEYIIGDSKDTEDDNTED